LPLVVEIPTDIKDQKEVVEILKSRNSKVDAISTELTHQLQLVKKLRQQLLQDAVQGKLVAQNPNEEPASELLKKIKAEKENLIAVKKLIKEKKLQPIKPDEIPFEIPENWLWCRFYEVVNIESNLASPFDYPNKPHIAPDNIEKNTGKLLSYKTVKEDNVQSANHYFYSGQLIYSKVRPKLNKVVKVDFEGLCSADMYPLRPLVNTDYIQKCMLSEYFLNEVDKFDNRVKMPKINQNQLSQIPVPLPPLGEQYRIVQKLDELMQYCNELEESIKQSESQNEKLLQQVLIEALRKEPVEA
jgi:type I restriction enzyme S subunit